MIGKSDIFILVVSASLLAAGVYRWQQNLALINSNSQQAQSNTATQSNNGTVVSSNSNSNPQQSTATVSTVTSVQTNAPVTVVNQPADTTFIASNINDSSSALQPIVEPAIQENQFLLGSYTVVSGDYLSKIAQQFGTTVETLQEINNINGSLIEVGQEIQFPLPAN